MSSIEALGRKDHLTFRGNVKQGRHAWLRLTPAYSLHVVEEILQDNRETRFALDPFSGTGTTPLSAAVHGIPCHATDINPFLVWFGNVKLARYSDADQAELREQAEGIVKRLSRSRHARREWVPDLANIDKWWDAPVLEALSRLFRSIREREGECDVGVQDLLKIAFLRVMISNAHVSFGHQSMSFKRRNDETPLFQETDVERVFHGFLESVEQIAKSLATEQPSADAKVLLGDSRNLHEVLPRNDYSLVVTSPPYPNRMSYIRELRPYMYWLGYLESGRQAGDLDWQAIGGTWGCATSNLNGWEPENEEGIPYDGFNRIVADIRRRHDTLGKYVLKYFHDVALHLANLRHVLAHGARCYYVVGNSKFYDTIVPVEEIYAALFRNLGYGNVGVRVLRKRTSKKELFEYCVTAKK